MVIVWNHAAGDRYAEAFEALGINLVKFDSTAGTLHKLNVCRKKIREHAPQTLQSFTFYLNFYAWLICLFTQTLSIGGIRNRMVIHLERSGKLTGTLAAIFPQAKISNNHLYLEGMPKGWLYNRLKQHTLIVTNHLDISEYAVSALQEADLSPVQTASIGRLYGEKRVDLIIEVIRDLVKQQINVKHVHAGDGPEKEKLAALVAEYGLNDHFFFAGELSDVSLFLSGKYLFIHAADYEGYPNVIMEAMACGKAIVSTDCGDTGFLVANNINGYLAPTGDSRQLSKHVSYLVQHPEVNASMGRLSRTKAEQLFDLNHLLNDTQNAYNTLLYNSRV